MSGDKNDHDRLVEMNTKLDLLMGQFTNHLKHHFLYTLTAFSVTLTAIAALIVTVIMN